MWKHYYSYLSMLAFISLFLVTRKNTEQTAEQVIVD